MEDIIDPAIGFISVDKLYRKLKDKGLTRKQIEEQVESLQTYQVNQAKKKKYYSTITASFVGDITQADLMDMTKLSTANNGVKYLLTFIDVYSRLVLVEPIKNKNSSTVAKAMKSIINRFPEKVNNLTTDDGSEFHKVSNKRIANVYSIP